MTAKPDDLDPDSDEWAHAQATRARRGHKIADVVATKTDTVARGPVQWPTAPIERRPFDEQKAREAAFRSAVGEL